ncbi:threonine-phosphate decarboxylase CobD [Thalassotalea sp. 1_MG-2023]|uniref:threonine-phosphate decarboxylase CobD n=1 Tax=Thalassotalea sp. 1_MG-2023 TaxID=3062680 RepID=UPI0026E462A3|nr:threonine-phosphate decarboxylase CobD [Thalassotalea sp. 1_MG-2023]MDO6427569.1 threonine-phosphate decarboxylase CobD [Thalassotalea sp. 1_MG-2023]
MALTHGGQLTQVANEYQIPMRDWLDLSTGIAPFSYPIPEIPDIVWQQLPQPSSALISAAQRYYQCRNISVSSGSQTIISLLPMLWLKENSSSKCVFLPIKGYKEHAQAWKNMGFNLQWYGDELPALEQLPQHCVLVVINPNNPTGKLFSRETLERYQEFIENRQGLLVIDEAFMDVITPSQSMAEYTLGRNTVVLKSFGKFFGLAGMRIGFTIAHQQWLTSIAEHLGPWQANGPAQFIAEQALQNTLWQEQQREKLSRQRQVLTMLLNRYFNEGVEGTDLFLTVNLATPHKAVTIYDGLCKQGVYVRLTDDQQSLRFGIPKPEDVERLSQSLGNVMLSISKLC